MQQSTRLRGLLAATRQGARRRLLADGLCVTLLTMLLAALVSFGLDYWLELDRSGRILLGAALALCVFAVIRKRLIRPLSSSIKDIALASLFERAHPEVQSSLSSAIDFESRLSTTTNPDELAHMREVIAAAEALIALRPQLASGMLVKGFLARRLAAIAALMALVIALVIAGGQHSSIWAKRNLLFMQTSWPRATTLQLVGFAGGEMRIAQGDDAEIVVVASGVLPASITLLGRFDDSTDVRVTLHSIEGDGRFTTVLEHMVMGCMIEIACKKADPVAGRVIIVERPTVQDLQVEIVYPAYMRRESDRVLDPGTLEIPAGSTLRFTAMASKPLARAAIRLDDDRFEMQVDSAGACNGSFIASRSATLSLEIEDRDGLAPASPSRIQLLVAPDLPPEVTLTPRGVGPIVTPRATIQLAVRAQDDHGVAAIELVTQYTRSSDESTDEAATKEDLLVLASSETGAPLANGAEIKSPLDFESLNPPLVPGDRARVAARARDFCDQAEHPEGVSESFEFKIVSEEEFLTEIIRRQMELRRDFERACLDQQTVVGNIRAAIAVNAEDAKEASNDQVAQTETAETSVARRVEGTALRFRQILAELETCKLAQDRDRVRIGDEIASPLEEISLGALRRAAVQLASAREHAQRGDRAASRSALEHGLPEVETALAVMQRVLDNMMKQETYGEILSILREVIRLHHEAGQSADEERRRRILDILEDEGERK